MHTQSWLNGGAVAVGKATVLKVMGEEEQRFYRSHNIPVETGATPTNSVAQPPAERHVSFRLEFTSQAIGAYNVQLYRQLEAIRSKRQRQQLVESIHTEFEKQCAAQNETIEDLQEQLKISKNTLKQEKERLICQLLMSKLEVERLMVLCNRLNTDCEDVRKQLDQATNVYDQQLLTMYCGVREEYDSQLRYLLMLFSELKNKLSKEYETIKSAYLRQLLLARKEQESSLLQQSQLLQESHETNRQLNQYLQRKQQQLDAMSVQLNQLLVARVDTDRVALLEELSQCKQSISELLEQQREHQQQLQQYQSMIYKLKGELESCSNQIVELKQSSSRLSLDRELESKKQLNQQTEQVQKEVKQKKEQARLLARIEQLQVALEQTKLKDQTALQRYQVQLEQQRLQLIDLTKQVVLDAEEKQRLEQDKYQLNEKMKQIAGNSLTRSELQVLEVPPISEEHVNKMARLENQLQETILILEADLRERDQRILMLEAHAKQLQTSLQSAEQRYKQVPRLPTQKLEQLTDSIVEAPADFAKDSEIEQLSRKNEELSLRAMQLEEQLNNTTTELQQALTSLQQQTKLNERLQNQLADKTTQIELMANMYEQQLRKDHI